MCFQSHISLSVRLRDTGAPVATPMSGALLGRGYVWPTAIAGLKETAPLGTDFELQSNEDKENRSTPADLYVGTDHQIDSIPAVALPAIEEVGL